MDRKAQCRTRRLRHVVGRPIDMKPIEQAANRLRDSKDKLESLLLQSEVVHQPERLRASELAIDSVFVALLRQEEVKRLVERLGASEGEDLHSVASLTR